MLGKSHYKTRGTNILCQKSTNETIKESWQVQKKHHAAIMNGVYRSMGIIQEIARLCLDSLVEAEFSADESTETMLDVIAFQTTIVAIINHDTAYDKINIVELIKQSIYYNADDIRKKQIDVFMIVQKDHLQNSNAIVHCLTMQVIMISILYHTVKILPKKKKIEILLEKTPAGLISIIIRDNGFGVSIEESYSSYYISSTQHDPYIISMANIMLLAKRHSTIEIITKSDFGVGNEVIIHIHPYVSSSNEQQKKQNINQAVIIKFKDLLKKQ